ncbi:MAG TPA: hypothetical protein VL614_08215 [Acetobacteraceae bacterium]|nr:hypothetical protein [Acetobacteraceae bacterium]
MARIVHTVHRYKRPPKRKKTVPLKVSRIARAGDQQAGLVERNDRSNQPRIVTVKRKPGRFGDAPDMTAEEHQRRGDAADERFRELVRRATGEA